MEWWKLFPYDSPDTQVLSVVLGQPPWATHSKLVLLLLNLLLLSKSDPLCHFFQPLIYTFFNHQNYKDIVFYLLCMVVLPQTCIHPYDLTSVFSDSLLCSRTHACNRYKQLWQFYHKLHNPHMVQHSLPSWLQQACLVCLELCLFLRIFLLGLFHQKTNHQLTVETKILILNFETKITKVCSF